RFADARVYGVDRDQIIPFRLPARIDGAGNQKLVADESRILAGRNDGPDDFREEHCSYAFAPAALPIGSVSSRLACGRGMTCTDPSSPPRRAAAAPASVAALTAATSPRTIAVT